MATLIYSALTSLDGYVADVSATAWRTSHYRTET